MYDLSPRAVFAHERVFRNPGAVERMDRMIAAIGWPRDRVETVGNGDLERVIEAAGATNKIVQEDILRGGHGRFRQGILKLDFDPVLVFNTFVWDETERESIDLEVLHPQAIHLKRLFEGAGEEFAWSRREKRLGNDGEREYVCQGGWGIHTLRGCVHKCDYCGQGFLVNMMLDIEDFCERLAAMLARRPEQKLYRYELHSDILAFEPEYDASRVIGECFAETDDQFLLLYTRSDNVDFLLDMPDHCKRHVLINWTLSMDTVAREIERDSPSLDARIEAMRKCREAGYVVRAGFSPIVPIRDWRRETTEMLERLFDAVEPEVLRVWALSMMEADEFERMFDPGKMDPRAVARMREAREEMAGRHHSPFPPDVRAEIYEHYFSEVERLRPGFPMALCTEHPDVWDRVGGRVHMTPEAMFCCCGGQSPPRDRGTAG